jgi:hypothetical protein
LKKLVDNASENNDVKRVIADRAYDSKENFRYLFDNGIEAAIKVRKNSSHRSMDCYPRKVVDVLRQLKDLKNGRIALVMDIQMDCRNSVLFHEKNV